MDSSKASAGNGKSPVEIKVFENTEFGSVRTALIDGEPFFVGKDVAAILGYTNPLKAVRDHVDEDDKGVNDSFTPEGGTQKTIFINESGLYSLILSSKLPAAKKFKHWVTSEVLPQIRNTGSYTAPAPKSDRELSIEEARILESLIPLCPVDTYRQILASHIARKVTGEFILPLPKAERKSYSAGQVGEMLGVSGNSIGRIANSHGLKTPAYGEWIWGRARNGKQVKSFVYYEDTVDIIRELLGSAAGSQGESLPFRSPNLRSRIAPLG